MTESTLLIICVNYKSEKDTVTFVKNVLAQSVAICISVVIVDNESEAEVSKSLQDSLPDDNRIFFYRSKVNLGYFGGARLGLHEYLKVNPFPEWIIVCNTDIYFPESDFISNLTVWHNKTPYLIIAPSIFSELSGKDQNPYITIRPTRLVMNLYKWVFQYTLISIIYQVASSIKGKVIFYLLRRRNTRTINTNLLKIYAPHGSFIAFKRKFFEAGGNLDCGTFLFGEEIYIAETSRNIGVSIVYDPRLKIIHREHSTTGIIPSIKISKFIACAHKYNYETFFEKG